MKRYVMEVIMKETIGIIEIGSTNTKAYSYTNNKVIDLGFKTIEFKSNYNLYGSILPSDTKSLIEFINNLFDHSVKVFVYATSIFRELNPVEIDDFENKLKQETSTCSVNIVTAKMENELTVVGAMSNVSINENVCVFIGGGGSTEISICKNGKILEMVNSNIGVTHILKAFPELSADYSTVSLDKVTEYISKQLNFPSQKADYLILAGGDFLLRYENAHYPVKKNTLFNSPVHPYLISYNDNRCFEERYYHEVSLSKMKQTTPDNPNWWNGTRAMCAFTNAIALAIGTKTIIPTKISMISGIVAKLNS